MLLELNNKPSKSEWNALRLMVLSASLLMASIITIIFLYSEYNRIEKEVEQQNIKLNEFSNLVAVSVASLDYSSVSNMAKVLLEDEVYVDLTIVDQFKYTIVGEHEKSKSYDENVYRIVNRNLVVNSNPSQDHVGLATFVITKHDLFKIYTGYMFRGLIIFVILFFALMFAFHKYISNYVTLPALQVARAMQKTIESGTPVPVEVSTASQIDELVFNFNKMQSRLTELQDQQISLTNDLQQSIETIKHDEMLRESQLKILSEVLHSSGQSLVYYDSQRKLVIENLGLIRSTVIRDAMKKYVLSYSDTVKFLKSKQFNVTTISNIQSNWIYCIEIQEASGKIWLMIAISLAEEGVGVLCSDITERRMFEQQINQVQKMESLGVLASGIAHEFNNVLAIIQGNLQLLKSKSKLKTEQNKYVDTAFHGVERATEVIQSMLTFSRTNNIQRSVFSISDSIRMLEPVIRGALPPVIKFHIEINAELSIDANRGQFESCILNLIFNARDALENGGHIKLKIDHKTQSSLQDIVVISVIDNGPGVKAESVDKIFDPFFTTNLGSEGTGLGLALVYSFAKSNSGNITYKTAVDGGTVFELILPATSGSQSFIQTNEVNTFVDNENKKVLFIEDEPELANIMVEAMQMFGINVHAVLTLSAAEEYLQQSRDNSIDLIITDYKLNDGTGDMVFDMLDKFKISVPVILISGDPNFGILDKKPGSTRFSMVLQKPVSFNVVKSAIVEALSLSKS